jgi:hypothetical protein
MIARLSPRRRKGFALLLVVGFNVLLFAAWGVAYRSVGSAYRVELARSERRTRDDGTMTALGKALALLQTGSPTNTDGSPLTGSESYVCYVQLSMSSGYRWFSVTYTPEPTAADGSTQQGFWSVRAFPVDQGGTPTMPDTF